ncbi:MAG: trypsin-like peptidase domain-containing protein [Bacteriovoracaceae bacterium]|nr:trypsin-like peptidase domain-containing protein [Bacteriovoracaceae bacterium]
MKISRYLVLSALLLVTACNGSSGGGSDDPVDTQDPKTTNSTDGQNTTGQNDGPDLSDADPSCVERLGLDKVSQEDKEVIIGTNTWVSSNTITDTMKKANAQATVYVRMTSSRCTGFLINEDTIMTNNHCIGNSSQARGVTVKFDYVAGKTSKQYTCDQFIGTNSALDFTLVKCDGSPGKDYPQVVLAEFQGKTNDPIYLVHQNCDYTKYSTCTPSQKISTGSLIGSTSTQVKHNADTLGGSSGSPIFDEDSHKVVAIHNAGLNHGANNGGTNYGIQMYKIVDYIKSYFPSVKINSSSSRAPAYSVCD